MSLGGPHRTKADKVRLAAIKELGCIIAHKLGLGYVYPEEHHLTDLGPKNHRRTIGLNSWSHRAVPVFGWTHEKCRSVLGPSLAEGSKPFHATFGSSEELLAYQDQLLGIVDG